MPTQSGRSARVPVGFSPRIEPLEDRITPVVIAVPDVYTAPRGEVTTIPAARGLLNNDFSTADFGAVLAVTRASQFNATGTIRALPPNTLEIRPDGSLTIIPPEFVGFDTITDLSFTYTVTNLNDPTEGSVTGIVRITVSDSRNDVIAVGAGPGGAPVVKTYQRGTGELVRTFLAYEPDFTGGVRVVTGDLNRDGVDDIVTVPGFGGAARVKVFDGQTLDTLFDTIFLDPTFRGGGYLAIGDQVGNGDLEIILGAGEGGGPIVTVIEPGLDPVVQTGEFGIIDFFAYDPDIRTGVRVATGDVFGDGTSAVVTAPGVGGGPVVRVFDSVDIQTRASLTGLAGTFVADPETSFFAGDTADRGGVALTTGDLDGDGTDEIVASLAADGPSQLRTFNARGGLLSLLAIPVDPVTASGLAPVNGGLFALTSASGLLLSPTDRPDSLVTGIDGPTSVGGGALVSAAGLGATALGAARGTVSLSAVDWDGDGIDDIITGAGPGYTARVRILDVSDNGPPVELENFLAFELSFLGGVNVGG